MISAMTAGDMAAAPMPCTARAVSKSAAASGETAGSDDVHQRRGVHAELSADRGKGEVRHGHVDDEGELLGVNGCGTSTFTTLFDLRRALRYPQPEQSCSS
ncbi:hypothetical protein [Streptomyces sp. BPSDS2]|uniref:hypothetical protein n=1 Tax=Streptomyces sp. BPSDS2 TaxID=2571021 RepID=UPI0014859FA6|nr:hypothetical protein [Streptomyces sp. BPSDS2]